MTVVRKRTRLDAPTISDSDLLWCVFEDKMTIHFEFPDVLTPNMLDGYLAEGWFRMRQAVFTCRYVMGSGILYTAVWIRVQLPGFQLSRSLRKLKSRNGRAFRHHIGPMVFTDEHHRLYARYRDNATLKSLKPSMKPYLTKKKTSSTP